MHTRGKPPLAERQANLSDTPLLVSVPEAARLLGIGTTFGWILVRSGQMPAIKLGRRVLIPRAAIEQLTRIDGASQALRSPPAPTR
jgi:excisionase family DNA binding protein